MRFATACRKMRKIMGF